VTSLPAWQRILAASGVTSNFRMRRHPGVGCEHIEEGCFDEAGRMMRLWTARYGMDIGDEGSLRDFSGDL
jgi:hypothetical protein